MSLTHSLTRPLATPLTRALTAAGVGGFNPASLFAANEPGWVYDNDDLTGFYLDSAMTTPATVNGLVGAQRDKSGRGNHRTQATTANKPVLRGTPTGANLFTAYGTPEAGWADSGGGVATGTATTGNMPTTLAPVSGRVYRLRWTLALTGGSVRYTMGGQTGTTRTASGTYEAYVTASSTAALTFDAVTAFSGTVSAVDVRDVTADAVTAPYGLHFDGVDDFMQTAAIDLTGTDKLTTCLGVRKLSDTPSNGCAVENTVAVGSFGIFAPGVGSVYYFRLRGDGVGGDRTPSVYAAPRTDVLTCEWNIGGATLADEIKVRVSGAVPGGGSAGTVGAGNFGNHVTYFGRRSGTSLPFTGLLYGGVCIGRTATAAELSNIERWTARRTGVTL
jgi:hypothetical protein